MIIHVVQAGETLKSIAENYGVSEEKIIIDNELINPVDLVPGQTIVIVYPSQTYIVKEGDNLASIALQHNVSVMQLLRNNPYLSGRQYIYPGEEIVISYKTSRSLETYGFSYAFIDEEILRKTLPYLTYLSFINYRTLSNGEMIQLYDDTQVIRICKEYGTIPLLMTTTLDENGNPDFEVAYNLLLNEVYQDKHIEQILDIIKDKGYYGVNFVFTLVKISNQHLYVRFIEKAVNRLGSEGYRVYVTLDPNYGAESNNFERVELSEISRPVESITFLHMIWSLNYGPPRPISSAANIRSFIEYAINYVPADKIVLGKPILAYDWTLPYSPRNPAPLTLTINSAIRLAVDVKAVINFDETSQTPYFEYVQSPVGFPVNHIVWFIDARSIRAMLNLINDYNLSGAAVWNIMIYNAQLWLMINSEYDIVKLLPTI